MTIKQNGGVFGRNPTFNDVTIEGDLILNGETFTGLDFNGSWNASTNSPTLSSGTGTQGEFYIVSVAGTTNLDGVTNWGVGDYCFFNGTAWQRIEGGADGNFVNLSVSGTSTLAAVNCANITSTGTINMNSDSATLFFGADIDMRILHDGSNGTFRNDTGNLTLDVAGNVGVSSSNFTPDNVLHVQESALSGRSASNGNTSLTLEHATDTGIQFFSATQTQLRFGDAASTGAGSIIYTHSDNSLKFSTAESQALLIDANGNATFNSNVTYGGDLISSTAGASNFVAGSLAGNSIASGGTHNVLLGEEAGRNLTVGLSNTIVGALAGDALTDADANVAIGASALSTNTVGSKSIAVGANALLRQNPSTATDMHNIAIGHNTGEFISTGIKNTIIGGLAGDNLTTGSGNVFIGYDSGGLTTGTDNTFIGHAAGTLITSGSDNVVIGNYDGNEGGLDIRTSNGNIVLSDGDGNIRGYFDNSGNFLVGTTSVVVGSGGAGTTGFRVDGANGILQLASDGTTAGVFNRTTSDGNVIDVRKNGTVVGSISVTSSATAYNTSSDYRLKENVVALSNATTRLKQLAPKQFNFIADADTTVDGFLAHEVQSVVPEAITGTHNEVDSENNPVYQGIDQSKLVPLLVATIQELEARITALEGE